MYVQNLTKADKSLITLSLIDTKNANFVLEVGFKISSFLKSIFDFATRLSTHKLQNVSLYEFVVNKLVTAVRYLWEYIQLCIHDYSLNLKSKILFTWPRDN